MAGPRRASRRGAHRNTTGSLTETERARLAFLRASNMLWVLGSPAEAKSLIDDVSRTCSPEARSYTDAFLAV